MKKIFMILLSVACVFTLFGCNKKEEESDGGEEIANPWSEVETIAEASKLAGYDFEAPETIDGKQITYIAVFNGEGSTIEVVYDDITVRKALNTGADISGDYNTYENEIVSDGDPISYTVKGNDDSTWNNLTWTSGEYAYSITSTSGLSLEVVDSLVTSIK